MKRPSRIWWLSNGDHLTQYFGRRLWGTAGDEYGRKTWWVWLGTGVLVWASKDVRYPDSSNVSLEEVAAEFDVNLNDDSEDTTQ